MNQLNGRDQFSPGARRQRIAISERHFDFLAKLSYLFFSTFWVEFHYLILIF